MAKKKLSLTPAERWYLMTLVNYAYSRLWAQLQDLKSDSSVSWYLLNDAEDVRLRAINDASAELSMCVELLAKFRTL